MAPFKQKPSALPYSLSLFEDSELKLKPDLKSELKSELLLLLVSEMTEAGTY